MRFAVKIGQLRFEVDLLDTATTRALSEAIPFKSHAQTWGQEVYFSTPVKAKLESDARQVVDPGTVCFWAEGNALALPFVGDPVQLAAVKAGQNVTVEKA